MAFQLTSDFVNGSDDPFAKSIMLLADHFVMDLETQFFWVIAAHFITLKWGGDDSSRGYRLLKRAIRGP